MTYRILFSMTLFILIFGGILYFPRQDTSSLPLVTIANYGPHSSLRSTIDGIKKELHLKGFVEGKHIRFEESDVGFQPHLIPQMIETHKSHSPEVMVVLTTPVAQYAKGRIQDIPLVYGAISDPIDAGLIKDLLSPPQKMTGSSEEQNMPLLLEFISKVLPKATRVGMLYAPSERNDLALLKQMEKAAASKGMTLVAIPVDQPREVPMKMEQFKGGVDVLYVGTSGPIQPTLPAISAIARRMKLPVINAHEEAVYQGLALASFGVDYETIGRNAGGQVAKLLRGATLKTVFPVSPQIKDHRATLNVRDLKAYGGHVPSMGTKLTLVGGRHDNL